MIYQSINPAVYRRVPADVGRLLDIGCGGGAFGSAVKRATPCTVVGVTYSEAEAQEARTRIDHVVVADLNTFDPAALGEFDCIVCSHVLEHLLDPRQVLSRLRGCLAPGGRLVIALPNVLFWKQRLQFLAGRFRYTDGGLMDRTHVRFFDWESAGQLARDTGLATIERGADGGFPLSRLLGPRLSAMVDQWALQRWPGLFGFQFLLCCQAADPARGPRAVPSALALPFTHLAVRLKA